MLAKWFFKKNIHIQDAQITATNEDKCVECLLARTHSFATLFTINTSPDCVYVCDMCDWTRWIQLKVFFFHYRIVLIEIHLNIIRFVDPGWNDQLKGNICYVYIYTISSNASKWKIVLFFHHGIFGHKSLAFLAHSHSLFSLSLHISNVQTSQWMNKKKIWIQKSIIQLHDAYIWLQIELAHALIYIHSQNATHIIPFHELCTRKIYNREKKKNNIDKYFNC